MLTEQRFDIILKLLEEKKSVPQPSLHLCLSPVFIYASARSSFKPEKLQKSLLFCNWEYVIFSVYIVIQNPLVNHHIVI